MREKNYSDRRKLLSSSVCEVNGIKARRRGTGRGSLRWITGSRKGAPGFYRSVAYIRGEGFYTYRDVAEAGLDLSMEMISIVILQIYIFLLRQ